MSTTNFEETLSYDDVLLLPSYADMLPSDAQVTTEIVPNVRLNIPIISAAMDTVTEDRLAIALGLEGGVGVIHRNLSPDEQAHQVSIVKRYLNWIIESPLTVDRKQPVSDVWDVMSRYNISGLPVLENDKLCGIITSRDMRFCRDYSKLVEDVMTPNPVVEIGTPDIESAQHKFDEYKIEKLPVVDKENCLTGLITVKDMEKHSAFPRAALDDSGRLLVGAAVSPNDLELRMPLLRDARVDFVVLDTAHGDSANVVNAIKKIKSQYSIPVVGGNVATREGTRRLIDAGADAVKVGVGPGSICTTRVEIGRTSCRERV